MRNPKAILIGKKRDKAILEQLALSHDLETDAFFVKQSADNNLCDSMRYLSENPDIGYVVIMPKVLPIDKRFRELFFSILDKCNVKVIVSKAGKISRQSKSKDRFTMFLLPYLLQQLWLCLADVMTDQVSLIQAEWL